MGLEFGLGQGLLIYGNCHLWQLLSCKSCIDRNWMRLGSMGSHLGAVYGHASIGKLRSAETTSVAVPLKLSPMATVGISVRRSCPVSCLGQFPFMARGSGLGLGFGLGQGLVTYGNCHLWQLLNCKSCTDRNWTPMGSHLGAVHEQESIGKLRAAETIPVAVQLKLSPMAAVGSPFGNATRSRV